MKSFVRRHIWILSIFILSLLIRGLFLYVFYEVPYVDGVAKQDFTIAHFLVEGKGFSNDGVSPQYTELPGYSLFLAAFFFVFGQETGLFVARLTQIFLSALGVFLTFGIGIRLINRSAAYIAALLWALWVPEAFVSTIGMHDATLGILILASLYFFVRAVKDRHFLMFALSGFAIGISGAMRSDFVLLPVVFFAVLLVWQKKFSSSFAAFVLMMACTGGIMIPWGARNLTQFDKFTLVRDVTWQGMWEGFGEFKNPVGAVLDDQITLVQIQFAHPDVQYGTAAYQKILREKSLIAIRENPLWYGTMLAKRFGKMLAIGGTVASTRVFSSPYVEYRTEQFLLVLFHLVFFAIAIVSALIVRHQWRVLAIFWGVFFYGIGIHLPVYWEPRYLIPTETMLIFPAAVALVWFLKKFLSPKFIGN